MRWVISIGFLLLGFFLLFHPQMEKKFFDNKQEQLIEAFESLGDTSSYEEAVSPVEVQANTGDKGLGLLDGARGIIRIPKIDLEMMIFEGTTPSSLTKGIGMIEPHKQFGINNIGLAGHRATTSGKQFNRLDELTLHDMVEVQTEAGTIEFEVVQTFVVDRTQIEVLQDGQEPLLTLVTCTPLGQKNPTDRLIVQAKLKDTR
ncbi:class D sortase [Psychrobacillus lasiicapitis]|uniref:Class D sortase n=1 Tax=Psychrobacillus lasiicapitis TaxID=1636719 RepID=A0A544TBN6_9BACI|nr:class D sortase [Psychrobacillus lasiicapitis]TQR14871.1 class D sortase [Psychrobacillus lasiicapitis]GGA20626.1 sortase [Psychrobacillus lasiicapitis]